MSKFVSNEKYYDFKDVLILPKSSLLNSRSQVSLIQTFQFNNNLSWTGIPIIASNMTTVGTFDVYKVLSKHKIITAFHKFYKLKDLIDYNNNNPKELLNPDYFMISTGISDSDYNNLVNILDNFSCKWIMIDVANGYISKFKEFCCKIREKYKYKIIVAGNVTTQEGVKDLIDCGVDIIKCGIGGGSACTTRIQTGIGMPQLSCVLECTNVTKNIIKSEKGLHYILSDGGITCPGDLGKAFGAGGDFVMIGGEFAGHDENPGELITEDDGSKYKFFYGMSSSYAMKNNYATNNNTQYRSSEGREIKIKYKGSLNNSVENYLGGLRSTCSYTNSANIGDLQNNCKFILVNNQYNNNLVNGK
tara:strand:- start:1947 stop:3026 length:1080 start_codon:yes stop_codon:yes gene_type:complete